MTGPNWPRQRYELIVKKGATPLGIKLHQTKIRRGVYANGFAEGPYPPPGPQACMRVGDILVSVDGKDVVGASLPTALAAIEAARRRDRLRDFITAKQDDHRKGTVMLVFERLSPSLTFRDVALDPRKVVYLLNYMLEVRRSTSSTEEVSLDEARLMFWLEVQALFEMSVVMTPSREDMSKVYEKFFRQGSGFYVHELAIKPQTKKGPRKSWDGQLSVTLTPPAAHLKALTGKDAVEDMARQELGSLHLVDDAAAAEFIESYGGADGDLGSARRTRSAIIPPAALGPDVRGSNGGGGATEWLSHAEPGGGRAGDDDERFGGSELPDDILAGDLSKMFRASQEKVEVTLTMGAFFRFKTSPWFGRMVAHLSNSPDFVHVSFEKIMAEQELRDVMMLHLVIGQEPGWLQVWREVEMSVKPRLAVLQTRRSVRQRPQAMGNGVQRHRRCTFPGNGEYGGGRGGSEGGAGGGPTLSGTAEAKPDAAVAIVSSAVYLWDFFLSADSHASLGLVRNTNEYTTLQELMVGSSAAISSGAGSGASVDDGVGKLESNTYGLGRGREGSGEKMAVTAAAKVAALSAQGGDAGVDLAVSVGKALIDIQRQVLRKLCVSIYPEFQASSTYEHLCEELTTSSRSLRRPSTMGLSDTTVPATPVSPPLSDSTVDPSSPSSHWISTDGPGSPSGIVLPSAPTAPWPSQALTQVSPRYDGVGASVFDGPSEDRPRSPFIFVGGGEFSTRTGDGSPRRNLVHPGPGDIGGDPWSGALAYRSGGQGHESSCAEVPPGLSGPGFEELWNGGRSWVLEKVMRKIEIPSHVSRHRPPFGGTRAKEVGVRRLSRSGSGTSLGSASASPELRQHLCLPYETRRFGRRPYPVVDKALRGQRAGSDPSPGSPLGPTEDLNIDSGSQTGELGLASPPGGFIQALRAAEGYEVGEDEGRSGFRGSMSNDMDTKWCAEWAVTFSGWLEQGVTKVKMEHAVSVASREGSPRAVPDGLEAFFWPELPADGRGPCACCSPPCIPAYLGAAEGVKRRGSKSRSRGRRLYSEFFSQGKRPPIPPPRVITFAAPGRNGVGTFYGVCLSVYRLVPQWVGELPASPVVLNGRHSSPSPVSPATTMAAVGYSDVAPLVSGGDLCTVHETTGGLSAGIASGESPTESNAPASGLMAEEERSVSEGLRVSAGSEAADSEENAVETETMTTSVVETISSPLIDLSRLRRGMGIFGKATLGQNKASPATAVVTRIDGSAAGVSGGSGGSTSSATKEDTRDQRLEEPSVISEPLEETLEPRIATVKEAVNGSAAEGAGITLEVNRDSEAASTHADGHQDAGNHLSMVPLDTPSRFKMNIGMFGSGKSPAGHRRGMGSADTDKASKMVSNSSTTIATTSAPAGGGGGGSGSGLKFASYARRAGNFIGSSDSRNNAGRSHKLIASTSSPDVHTNGPPAPTPGIPTYLASRAVDLPQRSSLPFPGAPEGIEENSAVGAPRNASDPGLMEAGGTRGEVGTVAGTSAATTISDAGGMKGRSLSSTTSDSGGFGGSLSDSPRGVHGDDSGGVAASTAAGNHRGDHEEGGRQLHVYYVPSGVCLISTRPEIGAMRRSIAEYWSAHADEITASVVAAEGDDLEGFQDVGGAFPGTSVGAWTQFTADEIRDALNPFVVRRKPEKRQEQGHHDHDCHRHQRQVSEAARAVTTIDVFPKSYSVGDMTATANLATERSDLLDGDEGAATLLGEPNGLGQRHRPASNEAERSGGLEAGLDFDPSVVFRCLSPRHLCLVVTALLCERKVVMVSSHLSLLTMAGEVFRSLLHPLSWSHVYVPLLPRRMAGDLLQCPTPYLLGLDSETAAGLDLPKDAMRIYLDVDVILSPKDFVGLAPMSILCARLSSVWNPGVDDLDYPLEEEGACAGAVSGTWSARTASDIISLFREFVAELLQGAAECTFEVGQGSTLTVLLDERLYKHAKAAAAKEAERFYEEERRLSPWGKGRSRESPLSDGAGPLYNRHCSVLLEQFVKTQMLSQFLSEGTWL